jgi:predicted glutamine amidotransferase
MAGYFYMADWVCHVSWGVIFMCELLGLCFNTEVSVHLAFSGLTAGAMKNPDGWGVGWYDEYGLLSWLSQGGIQLADKDGFILLHEKLREINRLGTLNLIFSNGRHLFAYHDRSGHVGLHFLLRQAPYPVVRLRGQYLTINLADVIDPEERGYIVASQPLSNENWNGVEPGQLLVFSQGNSIFTSVSE